MPKKKTTRKNPLRPGRPGMTGLPKKGDTFKGWEIIKVPVAGHARGVYSNGYCLKKDYGDRDVRLWVYYISRFDKMVLTAEDEKRDPLLPPLEIGFDYKPKSKHISGSEWREVFSEAIPTIERNLKPGRVKAPIGSAKEALKHINIKRARAGERPLDPVAAGWEPEDVVAEAQRLGWKPKTNPKKAKKKAKKKALKVRAKKVGRKAKKAAKTPTGRAAIGAGIGALALGPIGAAGGAYAGLKLAPKKKKKNNPEEMVKISQPLGMMMADYYEASPNIEHAAAAGIRREKVEVSILKKARIDLVRLRKIQPVALEREQIGEIIEALNRIIDKQKRGANNRQRNPARAFKLETEVKRGRQKKAKKAISRSTSVRKAAGAAKSKSLRKRLAQINPDPTLDMLADKYAKRRRRYKSLVTSPSATESQIERAKQRTDKAERELLIYAEVMKLDPAAFQRYLEGYYRSKPNSRRRS